MTGITENVYNEAQFIRGEYHTLFIAPRLRTLVGIKCPQRTRSRASKNLALPLNGSSEVPGLWHGRPLSEEDTIFM
jgi:hypothetical protein